MLRRDGEGLVEVLPETPYKRLAEELIHAYSLTPATLESALAYIPAVKVKSHATALELLHTNRIKSAGNGLYQPGFLNGTQAVISLPMAIGTLFCAGHQRRHKIAIPVDCKKA
jgi:hypothetical protein